jgi:hypothetical protein
MENETILYDSNETLNREFILFEDEKEIFSQINKPSNYFVYSKNIDTLKNIPDELTTCSTNFYNIYPKVGETLTGEIKQVLFVDKAKIAESSNTVCLLGNLPDVEWVLDDIHCFVYKDNVKLIVPENTNLKALELKIDNKTYKLETLNYERLENNAYMIGLLKLRLLKPSEPIELSLFSYEKEKIVLTETLIVLPNLNITFNHSVFYGDIEGKITVSNNEQNNDFSWRNQDNEIICPMSDGNLLVKIPYVKWRIANKEWHNEPTYRKLWYKDLLDNGDLLEIDNPIENEEIKLFVKYDGQENEITKNRSGKFEIGRAIYANEGKKDISMYCSNARKKFELFNVATEEHFTENPLIYQQGKIYWEVEKTFIGDKDNEFFLAIKSDRNNFRNKIANINCEIQNLYEDVCKIQIKIKNKNIFSKQESYTTIFEDKLIIGNPKQFRYKNKYLKIEYVRSSFSNNSNWITLSQTYVIYNLKFIEEIDGDKTHEYYEGALGIVKNNTITKIEFMKNEKNEKERINPVHIELRSNNTFWLSAGYDKENDFYNENLMLNVRNELCFININDNKVINLYKFKEE